MGTVHRLPETLKGPPARQGNYWQLNKDGKLPPNVQRIRPMVGDMPLPEKYPMRPEAYIVFALIKALEGRAGLKTIRDDTFQEVVSMYQRWGKDEDVNDPMRVAMRQTFDLFLRQRNGARVSPLPINPPQGDQTMTDNTTRRALFGGAATLALAAPVAAIAAPMGNVATLTPGDAGVSPLWAERDRLFNTTSKNDEEGDLVFDQMVAVENRILRGPIHSAADIAALLRLVVYGMDVGFRDDGAERAAMVEMVERLEGPVAPHLRLPVKFT